MEKSCHTAYGCHMMDKDRWPKLSTPKRKMMCDDKWGTKGLKNDQEEPESEMDSMDNGEASKWGDEENKWLLQEKTEKVQKRLK